jgi:hypothetical protein
MKPTLGLTGLTMNAMALIAPGAFLWLTFVAQGTAGNTAPAMWAGILFAVLLYFTRTTRSAGRTTLVTSRASAGQAY